MSPFSVEANIQCVDAMIGKIIVSLWIAFMVSWIYGAVNIFITSGEMQKECDVYMAKGDEYKLKESYSSANTEYLKATKCYNNVTHYINSNHPVIAIFIKPLDFIIPLALGFSVTMIWLSRGKINEIRQ